MPEWTVKDAPTRLREEGDCFSGSYVLENELGETCRLLYRIPRSVRAIADSELPRQVAEAKRTDGLSRIERMLRWRQLPEAVEPAAHWIVLHHRAGGSSRVDMDPRNATNGPVANNGITILHGPVTIAYDLGVSGWLMTSSERGRARGVPQPLQLQDVLADLGSDSANRQRALDIDPEGGASLSAETAALAA